MQVAIVVYPGMTALDVIGPYELFHVAGYDVRFVWDEVGPIVCDSGVLVIGATHTFDETPSPDLVLVGGSTADTGTAAAHGPLKRWLQKVHETTRYTTSVCSGSVVLAAAGILEGKPATSHWAALPFLKAGGAEPRANDRVVRDGKVFTAAGVSAGLDLALTLIGEIDGRDKAEIAQLVIEYDPQPPYDAGHMSKARPEIQKAATRQMRTAALNPRDLISLPTVLARRFVDKLRK